MFSGDGFFMLRDERIDYKKGRNDAEVFVEHINKLTPITEGNVCLVLETDTLMFGPTCSAHIDVRPISNMFGPSMFTSVHVNFGPCQLRLMSTSAHIYFGPYQLRPISTSAQIYKNFRFEGSS